MRPLGGIGLAKLMRLVVLKHDIAKISQNIHVFLQQRRQNYIGMEDAT